jgi:hypothetical protein
MPEQLLASLSQRDAARGADEKAHAELLLKGSDGMLKAGAVIPRSVAALLKLRCSATATNALSCAN